MIKRPPVTDEMIRTACDKVTKKHQLGDPEAIPERFYYNMPTGELVRLLNRDLSWDFGKELTEDFIDDLDNISFDIDRMHNVEVKKWFEENDIQPPYPANEGVRTTDGVIDGINEYGFAQYLVKPYDSAPKDRTRRIINFEDIVLLKDDQ